MLLPGLIPPRHALPVALGLLLAATSPFPAPISRAQAPASPNDPTRPEALAGNDQVRDIIRTRPGRGVMRDETPPRAPAEALATFEMRPGLAIDLVAHEPEVSQPLYLSFDSRGRLWVTQYRQYPFPAGLRIVRYDQHLRAKFDRIPDPPPRGTRGADIVSVHEDTDGDGRYDRSKVVLDGLNIATAAITGAGGIWVLNPPYLLFYPDANDDDVPDSEPVVQLRGFGLEDTHSVATSLQWGPDGWLYGATGSTTTGDVSSDVTRHVRWEGQHLWRFHPRSKVFQLFAEGGGNTVSLDIDSKGRVYSGTNAEKRGMHHEVGSYGVKGWGKHGPPLNPYAFEFFDHMPHQGDQRRFSQAFTIYEGGLLGEAFEGRIIAPNSLHNLIYASRRILDGAATRTVDEPPILTSKDRWFRPVDVRVGPDGCLYVADWYDTRLSHVSPADDWSHRDGRIYRIRPASGTVAVQPFNLHTAPPAHLVGLLSHPNEWFRKQAQLEMGWRNLTGLIPELRSLALQATNPHALDAVFALDQLNALDDETVARLLRHPDPYVRRWVVRQAGVDSPVIQRELPALASREPHPEVQSMLAAVAKRLPGPAALGVLVPLARTTDPRIRTMLWWLLESKCESDRPIVLEHLRTPETWSLAAFRTSLIHHLAKRWAMAGGAPNLSACSNLLALAPDVSARQAVEQGLADAFEGTDLPSPLPSNLAEALARLRSPADQDDLAGSLRQRSPEAIQAALGLVASPATPQARRSELALALAGLGVTNVLDAITPVFTSGGRESFKLALLPVLQPFSHPPLVNVILDHWESSIASERRLREGVIRLLASRPDWARRFLDRVDQWQIPASHVTPELVRPFALLDDPGIRASIERHWKGLLEVAPTEATLRERARLRNLLRTLPGDPARGRELYLQRCASCHQLLGDGTAVGPELTGYDRSNPDFWLDNILTPSLEIREGYGTYVIERLDGTVLNGMITAQDARSITLRDATLQSIRVPLDTIRRQTASPLSLMPAGLLDGLSDDQIRDFFAALMRNP